MHGIVTAFRLRPPGTTETVRFNSLFFPAKAEFRIIRELGEHKMKILIPIMLSFLLCGCVTNTNVELPILAQADLVKISYNPNRSMITEIKDTVTIEKLTTFINTLPNRWSIPWYGPLVGQYNFDFYRNGTFIGNFGVGSSFFCRTHADFFSQPASQEQIEAVGRIVGIEFLSK